MYNNIYLVIYCHNPFSIPLSGNIDTYCFDKTGTLTSTKVIIKGIVFNEVDGIIYNVNELKNEVRYILSGCVDCVKSIDKITGDPIDEALLDYTSYTINSSNVLSPINNHKYFFNYYYYYREPFIKRIHIYQFSSDRKRLSTIVLVNGDY